MEKGKRNRSRQRPAGAIKEADTTPHAKPTTISGRSNSRMTVSQHEASHEGSGTRFMWAPIALAVLLIMVFGDSQKMIFNSMNFIKWDGIAMSQIQVFQAAGNTILAAAIILVYSMVFLWAYNKAQKKAFNFRSELLVICVYSIMAMLMTYPLVLFFSSHVQGDDVDTNRCIWSLWWVKNAILGGKSPFFTDLMFYPGGTSLVFNTITPLLGVISMPLQVVFGQIVTYNSLSLLSIVWSGLGMFYLVEYLTSNRQAAMVSGLAFGLMPFRMARMVGQLNLVSTQWMPFFVLHLILALRQGDRRDAVLSGVFLAAIGWTEMSYIFFPAIIGGILILYHVWLQRDCLRSRPFIYNMAAFAAVSALLMSPWAYMIASEYRLYSYPDRYDEWVLHSADLWAFITPPSFNPAFGAMFAKTEAMFTSFIAEKIVYVGFAVLALTGAFFVDVGRRSVSSRRQNFVWVIAAGVFFLLSLGPLLHVKGVYPYQDDTGVHFLYEGIPLPYKYIGNLPIVSVTRTPVRFAIGFLFSAMVIAGIGLDRLMKARALGNALLPLVATLIVLEYAAIPYPIVDMAPNPGILALAGFPGSVVYDIPNDNKADYMQAIHGKSRLGGTLARAPISVERYWQGLEDDFKSMPKRSFAQKHSIDYFIVQRKKVGNEPAFTADLTRTFGEQTYKDDDIEIFTTKTS